jgi:hypothetical protein
MKKLLVAIAAGLVWAPLASAVSLNFADYPVDRVYKGDVVLPQFKGRDKDWRDFRTRITDGMAGGAEYAGEINVIQIGCGTSCTFITLGNVKTGRLYDFPRGGEDNTYLQVKTKPTSKLLAAQWRGDDGCHLEYYVWTGKAVKRIKDSKFASIESCDKDIEENLP